MDSEESREEKRRPQQAVLCPPSSSTCAAAGAATTATTAAAAAAYSPSSSPSHDFTFTISVYPSPAKGSNRPRSSGNVIDLAPADDIFFQGHLLPLRLLTRPPFSPRRRSTENITISFNHATATEGSRRKRVGGTELTDGKERVKASRSFPSLLKWRREEAEAEAEAEEEDGGKAKMKKKFDMKKVLKRYAGLVEALLFPRGGGKEKRRREMRQRPCSFSGVSSSWSRGEGGGGGGGGEEVRGRGKKRFSAPASMRTSPTNSGFLVAPPNLGSSEESTMEELQNAIQAAIAHCKNSMNVKEGEGGSRC